MFVLVECLKVLVWWILITFQLFQYQLPDVKGNLIFDYNMSEWKLELFLTDSLQSTTRIMVYCPTLA